MRMSTTQVQAMYLSQQLINKQEPEGGMLFFDAFLHYNVDYTPEGIRGLDALFAKIRQKGLSLEKIVTHPKHKNFLLTVAVFIGNCIGNRLAEVPTWYAYDNFSGFSNNVDTDKSFAFSLVGEFAYGISLPFRAIYEALLGEFSLAAYIESTAEHILSKSHVDFGLPANDVCNLFLKKVRTGTIIDNTSAYIDLLKKIHFDYSMQSLQKIDRVLEYIKTTEKLGKKSLLGKSPYPAFVTDPERQRFLYLLACYIGTVAAQSVNSALRWFNYEEMQAMLNDTSFDFSLENNLVMILENGQLRLPIMALTNYLFDLDSDSSKGALSFVNSIQTDVSYTLSSYPLDIQSSGTMPDLWHTAATLAGSLAAFSVVHACNGSPFPPMSLDYSSEQNKINIVSHMGAEVADLIKQLDIPSAHSPFNFLSYDMYVNLPNGRTDGIAIEIRVHDTPHLDLQLILPYRKGDHPLGFAIYPLVRRQVASALSSEIIDSFVKAFYEGARNIKNPMTGEDSWDSYYIDKHDLFAPPAWTQHTINNFDPERSDIAILSPS